MKPKEVIALAKAKDVKAVDLKMCDIHGAWQHFTMPISELRESVFEDGLGFDGSSIRGWKGVESSDMLVMPDANTAFLDPFTDIRTLSLICDIREPGSSVLYNRSPRTIAKRAKDYLKSHGVADEAYFGPEAEFFIFDSVRYGNENHKPFFEVDSAEGIWNTAREAPNLGYYIPYKGGYMPVTPADKTMNIRNEMMLCMQELGLSVERQHHEVATAGQAEIDIAYTSLLEAADGMCVYKYIVRNVANKYGKTATFMPKPFFGDNGSGMHTHVSLWKEGKTLMAGKQYAHLSDEALYFIGGLLKHAWALCAICNPTNNSYKRLIPGYEAPTVLAYSASNRSAVCRIPSYSSSPQARRVEFRCPDPAANPYLAFSAILMAGLDGIDNKIHPGEAMDKDLYHLPKEEAASLSYVPGSLRLALEALRKDRSFLLKGDVFSEDFLDVFIDMKMQEYDAIRLRPHPYEYHLYYDV